MLDRQELILTCECTSFDHMAMFGYHPLEEGEVADEDNVIFMSMPYNNLYRCFSPVYMWGFNFEYFFKWNFLKRFYYAFSHIFSPKKLKYKWRDGVLDSFPFQEKDHNRLFDYLSLLSKDTEDTLHYGLRKREHSNNFDVCFYVDRETEFSPYVLQYSVVFSDGKILKRIKDAMCYVFGHHYEQIDIELTRHNAEVLKAYILFAKIKNKESV
jgi:hypothetical protein